MVKSGLALIPVLILLGSACSSIQQTDLTPLSDTERKGGLLFGQHCASCHSISSETVVVGPPLANIASTAATRVSGMDAVAYLEQSILDPTAYLNPGYEDLMPKTFGRILTFEEISELIAYLLTLR